MLRQDTLRKEDCVMSFEERWRPFHEGITELARRIGALPSECACADADAHLEERCRCCGAAVSGQRSGARTCLDILGTLKAEIGVLHQLYAQLSEPSTRGTEDAGRELTRILFLTASDLEAISDDLDHIHEAVVGFRRRCGLTEMKKLKRHAAVLRQHSEILSGRTKA
jgi:hypothetical protein